MVCGSMVLVSIKVVPGRASATSTAGTQVHLAHDLGVGQRADDDPRQRGHAGQARLDARAGAQGGIRGRGRDVVADHAEALVEHAPAHAAADVAQADEADE